jgi:hypothetical protein
MAQSSNVAEKIDAGELSGVMIFQMTKPRVGDIVEMRTDRGLAYALYTHEHKSFGSLLRVFRRAFSSRPTEFETLLEEALQFATFFPLAAAVQRGIVSVVGRVRIPAKLKDFPIFRDGVADPKTRKVSNWWLWNGEREWSIGTLTEEQKKYPIREIVNDTLLKERIESGWTSEDDA